MSRLLVLFLGAIALTALCFFCVRNNAPAIQADIANRTTGTLGSSGYQFAGLAVDGRDVVLTGTAPSDEVRAAAGEAARSVRGVRAVDNQIEVVDVAVVQREQANTCQADFNTLLSAEKIRFASGGAQLSGDGFVLLNNLSAVAANCPSASIEIAGHTDSVGDAQMNLGLSQARAEAVRTYLINQGIDESRLTAVGYGETNPIELNGTASGRAANRRIEFRVAGIE